MFPVAGLNNLNPFQFFIHKLTQFFQTPKASLGIAGGGCKAFYGLGAGHEMKKWGIQFLEYSGVSAGAAMVLCLISETEEEAVEYFEEITRRNDANFKLSNLFFGERAFPHETMYRRTIRYAMDWDKIKSSQAKIFIQTVKAIPRKEKGIRGKLEIAKLIADTARAFTRDEKDKLEGKPANRIKQVLEKWKMTEIIYTEKDFHSPQVLEQIILNSSSVPPVVAFQNQGDEYYLDGGFTNNLVLERFSPNLPKIGIFYEDTTLIGKDPKLLKDTFLLKPSQPLPITSFDYTNPEGVRKTYELGKQDARANKDAILQYIKNKTMSHLHQPISSFFAI